MNFSHYLGLVKGKNVNSFTFAQGNRPAAKLNNGATEYLSEVFLFDEDMDALEKEILALSRDSELNKTFYLEGVKFKYSILNLKDTVVINVSQVNAEEFSWSDFSVPGYLNDWLETKSGVLVFYGADRELVEGVRLAFAKSRADRTNGSSLVFTKGFLPEEVGREGHFLSLSTDETGFLKSKESPFFDTYSFCGDLKSVEGERALRLSDRGAFVVVNSFWSELPRVWMDILSTFEDNDLQRFFLDSVVGFVGVKKVPSEKAGDCVVFEALPMTSHEDLIKMDAQSKTDHLQKALNKDGVSFNQSLHSLVMKREVSLENAYHVSPNPEELNVFLSDSGV